MSVSYPIDSPRFHLAGVRFPVYDSRHEMYEAIEVLEFSLHFSYILFSCLNIVWY